MTEQQIINSTFYLLEKDSDVWATTDDEYATARGLLNVGVRRWEHYDNTTWRELWTTLDDASDGTKTTTADTYDYSCPSDFRRPGSYVRIAGSTSSNYYRVLPLEEVQKHWNNSDQWCYFTGNPADGYTLHFNPRLTLTTGQTIKYEYYKAASTTSAASDTVDMSDPTYLSYFIAAHMSESTDNVDNVFFTISEGLLDQMKIKNMSGVWANPDNIEPNLEEYYGFGTGSGATKKVPNVDPV